jgi:hypothetical protein
LGSPTNWPLAITVVAVNENEFAIAVSCSSKMQPWNVREPVDPYVLEEPGTAMTLHLDCRKTEFWTVDGPCICSSPIPSEYVPSAELFTNIRHEKMQAVPVVIDHVKITQQSGWHRDSSGGQLAQENARLCRRPYQLITRVGSFRIRKSQNVRTERVRASIRGDEVGECALFSDRAARAAHGER